MEFGGREGRGHNITRHQVEMRVEVGGMMFYKFWFLEELVTSSRGLRNLLEEVEKPPRGSPETSSRRFAKTENIVAISDDGKSIH